MRTRSFALATAAALLAITAGCGEDDDTTAAGASDETPSASGEEESPTDAGSTDGGTPACPDVWVEGEALPDDYGGCSNDDGSTSGASWQDCRDGTRLYTHDSRFFTLADGTIVDAGDDLLDHPEFERRSRGCG